MTTREAVGKITGDSTSTYFKFTVNPNSELTLYEYVYVEVEDIPPTCKTKQKVRVLAQVIDIRRTGLGISPNVPWPVLSELPTHEEGSDHIIATAKVLGYKYDGKIFYPRSAPRVGSDVYLAPDELIEEFYSVEEEKRLHIGYLISRPNVPVYLNLDGIRRHVAIIAATGAGKTWSSVLLIEELLKKGATILVLDPHGEYTKIRGKLGALDPKLDGRCLVIKGHKNQDGDLLYKIDITKMTADELAAVAGVPPNATKIKAIIAYSKEAAYLLAKAAGSKKLAGLKMMIKVIKECMRARAAASSSHSSARFTSAAKKLAEELLSNEACIDPKLVDPKIRKKLEDALYNILATGLGRDIGRGYDAIHYLEGLRKIGVYSTTTVPIDDILRPSHVTVFNLSGLRREVQDHLVHNILTRIFNARVNYLRGLKGEKYPYPIVVVLEEAHRFIPPKHVAQTWSYDIVSKIAAEGRKFGVFLVVITQRPSKVDADVLSQCQSQIILRIVNPKDQDAVRDASEEMSQELLNNLPGLNTGEAVVVGPLAPAPVMIRLRDRVLEYSGGDLDVASLWKRSMEEYLGSREVEEDVLSALSEALCTKITRKELCKAVAAVISPYAAIDAEVIEKALPLSARDEVTVTYDPDTMTLKGVVDGESIEVRLAEGYWHCSSCDGGPCPHVVAGVLRAVASGLISPDDIKKALSSRDFTAIR